MADERDALAQAEAEKAALLQEISALKLDVAGLQSDYDELDAKTTKAFDALAKLVQPKLIGKDGINVQDNIIGIDSNVLNPLQQNQNADANQYPVNLIENGVLRILTPYTVEDPAEPDVD